MKHKYQVAAFNNEQVKHLGDERETEGTHLIFEMLLYLRQGHGSVLWTTPERNTEKQIELEHVQLLPPNA